MLSIQEFSLKCSLGNGTSRINRWITAAVKRNVKVLKFWSYTRFIPFRLPHCVVMSDTLVEIELVMEAPLIIPTSTCLSKLKILTLWHVTFVDEESTQKLLSCPTLEDLRIYLCGWKNIKSLKVFAPSLLKLSIMDENEDDLESEDEDVVPYTCQVLIQGAKISSITCWSTFFNKYCITTSTTLLLNADVCLNCDTESVIAHTIAANNASMLLNGLSTVQDLTLNYSLLEEISCRDELLKALPTFSNLSTLLLDYTGTDLSKKGALYSWAILERCPHLETLEYLGFEFYDTPRIPTDSVPKCFQTHLKKIVVRDLRTRNAIISHMEQLLGISMCLEELVIHYSWKTNSMKPKELLDRLTRVAGFVW